MSKIIGIAACSPEGIIAINGSMPWDAPEDLKHFKHSTINNVVIMGRITWDTLNRTILPNRINYIISNNGNYNLVEGTTAVVFCDVDIAISTAQLKYPNKDIYIMGGASIYKQTLHKMDEFNLSIIHKEKVKYSGGYDKYQYLYNYPTWFDTLFIEVDSVIGLDATYKKYQRRITTPINKKRIIN